MTGVEIPKGHDIVVFVKPGGRVRVVETDYLDKPVSVDAAMFDKPIPVSRAG